MDTTSAGKVGKYEIIKVLGRGGMGEVLLAQDLDLGRRVAIKRPFKSVLGDGLARFQVEARAATLRHPNIPAVYEMGEQDGLPFIAMEFVEGEPLDKIIDSRRPMELMLKLSIVEQVCSALGYAHEQGIIHRDIKPANIIVQPNGVAKIIDFGIAKIQSLDSNTGLTQTSQIIGSLHYIAPERFRGEAIDGRADIFSSGVILYLLLTGHLPFAGGEVTAAYKIVNEAHTALGEHIRDYPPALDGVLDKALAKDPHDRYSTAEDFADALHEVIEELKRTRVFQLFDDAERLTTESRFAPALELLDEAIKLDPANTQVRKLRRFVKDHQDKLKRAERVREATSRADEALAAENFDEALNHLREAQRLDSTLPELKEKIQSVEDRKRRYDKSINALANAEASRTRGDINGALRILEDALTYDPGNTKLLATRGTVAKQAESEARRRRVQEIIETARAEFAARRFPAVDQLLAEAESIDPANPDIDVLRRELTRTKEQEERRGILDEIQRTVQEYIRTDRYDLAQDLLNRALERLPNENFLHRLKAEVDSAARKFDAERLVDAAISESKDLFSRSPLEALSLLQKAIEQMPGEERLLSYERSLRQQFDSLRVEQLRNDTLQRAREFIGVKQFDKAIGILESYQVEFGNNPDVDELLAFARDEHASKQRRIVVERCLAESKALIHDDRLDDAIRLLEAGVQKTNDLSLSRLLEETRERQVASARKLDLLQKRIFLLRERGELDEAVQLLQEHQATTVRSQQIQELLNSILAEREQKQVTANAIATARATAKQRQFASGLETLQGVVRAYGDSAELTAVTHEIETERASYAQEAVGKSIEAARAALLKNDPQSAQATLKGVTELVPFADPTRQADWRRIGQSTKKAIEQPNLPITIADLDEPIARGRKTPGWIFAVGGVAVLAIVGVVWYLARTSTSSTAPSAPAQSQITVAHAPDGAVVTVDHRTPQTVKGGIEPTFNVDPGEHEIEVAKDGYEPFADKTNVRKGATVEYAIPSLPLLPQVGKSGNLTPQGNVPEFKVIVDGTLRGLHHSGDQITLSEGTHTIRYAAKDFQDSPTHQIQIAANSTKADPFELKPVPPPAPNSGNLTVQTTPGARISIDGGQKTATADAATGTASITGIAIGSHRIDITLEGHQSVQGEQVNIVGGSNTPVTKMLTAIAPTASFFSTDVRTIDAGGTATLSWQVNNAASVSIDGSKVEASGEKAVTPEQTTTYHLIANGNVPLKDVTITVRPKQVAEKPAPPPVEQKPVINAPVKPEGPDRAALLQALSGYQGVFARASGKGGKECQSIFNGSYSGQLKAWARWCDSAKKFEIVEKCEPAAGGSPDAPTLTCSEVITVTPKDGDRQPFASSKIFSFSRNADGAWQVSKW